MSLGDPGRSWTPGHPRLRSTLRGSDSALKRILSYRGVVGAMVIRADGIPIKTSLNNATTAQYARHLQHLIELAGYAVKEFNPQDALTLLRIKTEKYEILVIPAKEYLLAVLQDPYE
ncbi:dynein light chain roadblock-type 2-like isoform X1 [Ornithorhynchus anatinus]|uniref:dynein light chain roadblock-type 2-like isoform X1 n=1 Tax=Ornithorhynchus anatinus TaxID=9258 RepID=UPI0010A923A8|nr:dynein light chain roadblock-type 2-like isoform X1 [Ornithorhynchus anatinus]